MHYHIQHVHKNIVLWTRGDYVRVIVLYISTKVVYWLYCGKNEWNIKTWVFVTKSFSYKQRQIVITAIDKYF